MQPSQKVYCLNCNWSGDYDKLIEVPWVPDDDLPIKGETHTVCPECQSPAWEPDGPADNVRYLGSTENGERYDP